MPSHACTTAPSRPLPQAIACAAACGVGESGYEQTAVPLGRTQHGSPLRWRPAYEPHLLICGAAGKGKTALLRHVAADLAGQDWSLHVATTAEHDLRPWRACPKVQTLATSTGEWLRLLHQLHQEMEDRYDALNAEHRAGTDLPPVVLVVDEYRQLLTDLRFAEPQPATARACGASAREARSALQDIARKGSAVRMHLVMSAQRPNADLLPASMLDNFSARVALGRQSVTASYVLWGATEAAAEDAVQAAGDVASADGPGCGITRDADGTLVAFWACGLAGSGAGGEQRPAVANACLDEQTLELLNASAQAHSGATALRGLLQRLQRRPFDADAAAAVTGLLTSPRWAQARAAWREVVAAQEPDQVEVLDAQIQESCDGLPPTKAPGHECPSPAGTRTVGELMGQLGQVHGWNSVRALANPGAPSIPVSTAADAAGITTTDTAARAVPNTAQDRAC